MLQVLEDDSQWSAAIKHYQSAADFFAAENASTTALKPLAKVAELCVKVHCGTVLASFLCLHCLLSSF
jgi:hypothetical protein